MRILGLMLLGICCITTPASAQTQLPNWLPDEPLQRVGIIDEFQPYWIDDETVIFENWDSSGEGRNVTLQYDVTSSHLEIRESMSLRLDPTPENKEHYQSLPDAPILLSPFGSTSSTPLIYHSRLYVDCGHECSGNLVMVGEHNEVPHEVPGIGRYRPIPDLFGQCGVKATWGHSNVAVVHIGLCYGWGWNFYLVRLNQDHPASRLPLYIGGVGDFEQRLFAISEDGNRVLYESFPSEFDSATESLYYWQSTSPTESDPLSRVEREIEITAQDTEHNPFTAANFIPDSKNEIFAIHRDGILRINIETEMREIVNPEINSN